MKLVLKCPAYEIVKENTRILGPELELLLHFGPAVNQLGTSTLPNQAEVSCALSSTRVVQHQHAVSIAALRHFRRSSMSMSDMVTSLEIS